jgi:ceramide glucosyltransferase
MLTLLLEALVAVGLVVSAWYYCMTYVGARLFLGRSRRPEPPTPAPPITILKPLKGLDADLFENLASFCRQDYPRYQIVFGVADAADPAAGVVRRLQAQFPEVDIDLVVDARVYGSSYKISNLHNMYGAARHDLLVIADSDIRVGPDYLRRLSADLADPTVGVVTCLYRARSTGGAATFMESLFINADFAPSILVARLVETTRYAFGATIALRRGVLDEIGGFLALSNYLADDFFLGNLVQARGYRVVISDMVIDTILAVGSWRRLFEHQLRWARTYRSVRSGGYFALALTHGTIWALALLLLHPTQPLAWAISLALWSLRLGSAAIVANRYLHAPITWIEALAILPKDLLATAVWVAAFAGNTVSWSGHRFRVRRDGTMERLTPTYAVPTPATAYVTREKQESA